MQYLNLDHGRIKFFGYKFPRIVRHFVLGLVALRKLLCDEEGCQLAQGYAATPQGLLPHISRLRFPLSHWLVYLELRRQIELCRLVDNPSILTRLQ